MSALAPPQPAAVPAEPGAGRTRPPTTVTRSRGVRLRWLRRWVSPAVILVVWQLLSSAGVIPEQKIAAPLQILATARDLVADGTLGAATLVSVQRVGLGFAVGAAIGVTLSLIHI